MTTSSRPAARATRASATEPKKSSAQSSPPPATELHADYTPWANRERQVGQAYVHRLPNARFRIVMAGRQSGKTMSGIAEICWDAMETGGHINWWIAPNDTVKPRAWRGLLDFLPPEVITKKNETEDRIVLTNGSEIYVKSAAAPDSLVSEGLHFAVCDEAGQWKETVWSRGIRPMFTATKGRALLIGTPRGRNWFHKLWLKGLPGSDHDADYESFHWKTEDSPFSERSDLIEARKNLPIDIYKQEYEADPLENSSGVFRNVRECVRRMLVQPDQFTVVGADFARKRDFSAFIPMNSARQAISVSRGQEDWPIQKQKLASLAIANQFARIIGDEASVGDPIIQDLRLAGFQVEGINTNGPMKRTIIENLRLAFEQQTLSIPDDDVLIDELEAYEYEMLPSGQLRYSAPDGKYDDTVIALALALWGQRSSMYAYVNTNQQPTSYMRRGGGSSYMRKSVEASRPPWV